MKRAVKPARTTDSDSRRGGSIGQGGQFALHHAMPDQFQPGEAGEDAGSQQFGRPPVAVVAGQRQARQPRDEGRSRQDAAARDAAAEGQGRQVRQAGRVKQVPQGRLVEDNLRQVEIVDAFQAVGVGQAKDRRFDIPGANAPAEGEQLHLANRRPRTNGLAVRRQCLRSEGDSLDEAAAKPAGGGLPLPQRLRPFALVRQQQVALAFFELHLAGVVERQVLQGVLHANEFGADAAGLVALFFQPISEDQPRRIVGRVVGNGLQKGVRVIHGRPSVAQPRHWHCIPIGDGSRRFPGEPASAPNRHAQPAVRL